MHSKEIKLLSTVHDREAVLENIQTYAANLENLIDFARLHNIPGIGAMESAFDQALDGIDLAERLLEEAREKYDAYLSNQCRFSGSFIELVKL